MFQPPFSAVRFAAESAVAYLWAELYRNAIPEDEVCGINFRYLLILTPFVIALGKKLQIAEKHVTTAWALFFQTYLARLLTRLT